MSKQSNDQDFGGHSRRRFLQRGSAMVLAAGSVASARQKNETEQSGCTLGFSTYGMKTMTSEQAIALLVEIGFDSVELVVRSGWDADSAKLNHDRRATLRKQLQDSSIRLTSLMEHVFPLGDKQQATALERLKLAAEVAHDLSPRAVPLIQTVLGGGRFDEQRNQLRDRLGKWAEVAEETETTIAIKPHRGGVVSQPSEAIWLFEQLGKPSRLRMVYDYSHYAFRSLPLEQTIAEALPFTAHIAVKDAVQKGNRVVFELPGNAGTIDFAQLIRQFHAGGYRGDINCEVSGMVWSQANYDLVVAARECYSSISQAFEVAGVRRRSS